MPVIIDSFEKKMIVKTMQQPTPERVKELFNAFFIMQILMIERSLKIICAKS